MTIDLAFLAVILAMAATTYVTRIGGYLILRNRTLSPRTRTVLETAPGCVLITVIAPDFANGHPADLAALTLTILIARKLPLLPTILVAVATAGLLRHVMG